MQTSPEFTDCWFLSGATATGKTRVGLALARRIDAEIISLDSMAIYRGMDIGTAKPTPQQRRTIPHYLLDIREPHEEFSVAEYVEAAAKVVAEIRGRGNEALFVGGTPLYLKALLRGLDRVPEPDPEFRRQVEAEVRHLDEAALHRRVAQVDPLAASQIHPNDTKRLIRVLEVYKQTGRPLSHFQVRFEEPIAPARTRAFVLRRPRGELHERIGRRVEAMFAQGLVEEVKRLTASAPRGYPGLSKTARQAVGYREVLAYLGRHREDRRDSSLKNLKSLKTLDEAVRQTRARTNRFARKQGTWFRSLSECRFVDLSGDVPAEEVAERILGLAESGRETE